MDNKLTVKEAAELLGAGEQYIRWGIITQALPIGFAVKIKDSKRYTYCIPKAKFTEVTGIEV